jgi:hypothetical protein
MQSFPPPPSSAPFGTCHENVEEISPAWDDNQSFTGTEDSIANPGSKTEI